MSPVISREQLNGEVILSAVPRIIPNIRLTNLSNYGGEEGIAVSYYKQYTEMKGMPC